MVMMLSDIISNQKKCIRVHKSNDSQLSFFHFDANSGGGEREPFFFNFHFFSSHGVDK